MIDTDTLQPYFKSPRQLANEVLKLYFGSETPSYPIDPFKLLKEFGVIFQFRGFKGLEGVYIVPENDEDIALVGININRPITRQRFTAAHELCHHIKDREKNNICPINGEQKGPEELFADKFAGELLMPTSALREVAKNFEKDGYVSFDDAIYIADYFGVSFEACILSLAYRLNKISGETAYKKLKRRIEKFKPEIKRQDLGLRFDINLLQNVLNAYHYFFENECKAVWYSFKNDFVYNENRLEGVDIDKDVIGELLADLRLNKQNSEYCSSEFRQIVEVAGHSSMYDYILNTNDPISGFRILDLNKMLFQYAPFPDEGGKTRTSNNLVLGAKFNTVDYKEVPKGIIEIDKMIKELEMRREELTVTEYVDDVIKIHHRITVIHPFSDGNGRVSRAILNWQFKNKGLPPVYLKLEKKERYFDALRKADIEKEYDELNAIFYQEILNSMMQLNSSFLN